MYNGIGLQTPRGSGTNGYVQRNVACVKRAKDRVDYKSEAELRRADDLLFKEPNKEILEHERKRRIELKCVEMEELMEEQGFDEEEIRRKVSNFRKFLAIEDEQQQKQRQEAVASGKQVPVFPSLVAKDADTGRLVAKGTHEISAARHQQAELLRDALKIDRPAPTSAADAAAAASALPYLRSDDSDSSSSSSGDSGSASSASEMKRKQKQKMKKAAKKAAKKEKKDKKKKKKAKRSKKDGRKGKEKEAEEAAAAGPAAGVARRDRSRSPVARSDRRK